MAASIHGKKSINSRRTINSICHFTQIWGGRFFHLYANQNIPRNFIIDKEGKIAVSSTGFTIKEFEEIVGIVDELLK